MLIGMKVFQGEHEGNLQGRHEDIRYRGRIQLPLKRLPDSSDSSQIPDF